LPDEIQVYTDDLEARGELGVELHVNTTPSGRSTPDYPGEVTPYHGLRVTPEISTGLAPGWDAGVYLPLVRNAEGTNYAAGVKFRLKWMPLKPEDGGSGWFAGINGEVAFVDQRFEESGRGGELRPIIGFRSGGWLVSFNPILEASLAEPQKGVVSFAPALKVSRSIGDRAALGLEYYADLGRLSNFDSPSQQSHTLYAVLDTPWLNFGIGRGVNAATDRWTIKAIVSF
jgi:hypothetical protein